jgi:putative transposase
VAYHFVWCPKRRKRVLVGGVADGCERVIREVCGEHRWGVVRVAVRPDQVRLFVRAGRLTAAHEIVRACKGRTGRVLRDRYRELLRLASLWTRSYFCSTVGSVSEQIVDWYIAAQIGR